MPNKKSTMLTYITETPQQLATNTDNRKALTQSLVDIYLKKSLQQYGLLLVVLVLTVLNVPNHL
ncbi:MAG: hypothetical protein LUF02_07665 [Erysipelotrichaceae bacterium]|nr:hypothetical protein [Erysipelotrichaceae bacterium]